MTRLPSATSSAIESRIRSRFSAGSVWITFSRWSFQVLPTIVHTGAKDSTSTRSAGSSCAGTSRRRVIPNAQIWAFSKRSPASRSKSASSFGFELGKPASMNWMPRRSSACATRTFSSADRDIPSPCMPSRRVVSYRSICLLTWSFPFRGGTVRGCSGGARTALRARRGGNSAACLADVLPEPRHGAPKTLPARPRPGAPGRPCRRSRATRGTRRGGRRSRRRRPSGSPA